MDQLCSGRPIWTATRSGKPAAVLAVRNGGCEFLRRFERYFANGHTLRTLEICANAF